MRAIDHLRAMATNRPLAALIAVGSVSGMGDWLYLTALPILIYQRTGDVVLVGLTGAARLLPAIILSMPAGLVADRFPQRSILMITEAARAASMFVVAALCAVHGDIALILIVATAAAVAGTFAMPASAALLPRLAQSDEELGRANATFASLDGLANILGPAIAGVLVITGGLALAFAVNGLTFIAMLAVLALAVPGLRRSNRTPVPDADARGLGLAAIARRIARPLVIDGAISFGATALSVLAVVIAAEVLDTGAAFAGALNATAGIGAVLGGLASGAFVNRGDGRGILVGLAVAVPAVIVLGTVGVPVVALAAMGITTGALVLLDTLNTTTVQRLTADGGTGRAFGLLRTSAAVWWMAGSILPAMVAATYGAAAAVGVTAVVIALLGGAAMVPVAEGHSQMRCLTFGRRAGRHASRPARAHTVLTDSAAAVVASD